MKCRALMTRRVRASEPSVRKLRRDPLSRPARDGSDLSLGETQQVHQVEGAFRANPGAIPPQGVEGEQELFAASSADQGS